MSTPEDIQQLRITNQNLENRVLELTKLVHQLQSKLKTAHLVLNWPLDTTLENINFNLGNSSLTSSNHHGVTSIECLTRMTSVSVKDRTQIFSQNEKPVFPASPGIHRPFIASSPLKGFKKGETIIKNVLLKENMLQTSNGNKESKEGLYPTLSVQNLSGLNNNANFPNKFKSTNSLSTFDKNSPNEILQHSMKERSADHALSVKMKISNFVDFAAVPQNEEDESSSLRIKIPSLEEGLMEAAKNGFVELSRSETQTIDSDHVKVPDLRVNIPNSTYKMEIKDIPVADTLIALKTVDSTTCLTETVSNTNNDNNVKMNEIAHAENIANKSALLINEELDDVFKDNLNIPGIDAKNKVENNENKSHHMSVHEEPNLEKDSDNLKISTDKLPDSNIFESQAEQNSIKSAERESRLSYLGTKFGGLTGKSRSVSDANGAQEKVLIVKSLTDLSVPDEKTTKRNSRRGHNGESALAGKAVGTSKNETKGTSLASLQHFIASIKRIEYRSLTEPSGGRDVTYIIFSLNDPVSFTEVRFIEKNFFDFYALMQKVTIFFLNYIRYVKIPSFLVFLSHLMKVNSTPV